MLKLITQKVKAEHFWFSDEQNQANLALIETALITICLDSVPLNTSFNTPFRGGGLGHRANDRDETNMAHQMIHGGGSRANSSNRWFDKTIQVEQLIFQGHVARRLDY